MREKIPTETILCAAIWYKEVGVDNTNMRNPYNIDEGVVVSGHRHANCIYTILSITGVKQEYLLGKSISGFLTNHNRFVDRIEGAKIALASGQIKNLKYSIHRLYSEDLY